MTNQHPVNIIANTITKWRTYYRKTYKGNLSEIDYIAANAAQWGADQELEACCEVLARELICDGKHVATDLRMIRRPKPPSLKARALPSATVPDTIRRALEALDD
jgi:hypothetical protein